MEAVVFTEAMVGPWRSPEQVAAVARMEVWTAVLDDFSEAATTSLAQLDEMIERCNAIIETGNPDSGHPLLTVLSELQTDLMRQPRYDALASLWEGGFRRCLSGIQHDWIVGHRGHDGSADAPDIGEYFDHADSILVWIVYPPRWIHDSGTPMAGELDVLDHLKILGPALDSCTLAVRLANDLATAARERREGNQNNILDYGVSPDWVRAEIDRHTATVTQMLAPLIATQYVPAIELARWTEWGVGFYRRADVRYV
ncbi:terpene synthase family protein [Nocardia goodfellowii]|uniref:Terpene synthase n=1 Tax=Nocardia goodfellowii TaxID=882446 RepID=A0ABS4QIM9_9NOCA|nr:terpene synthase family protein [Nocardia goodfellowii]MBP2191568.1 hypothetical protein [Nocardia goodfellowii]